MNEHAAVTCVECGFESPASMRYCGMCGTPLPATCPECGFANPLGYRFCGQCGTPLAGTEAPTRAEVPTRGKEGKAAPPPVPPQVEVEPPAPSPVVEVEEQVVETLVTSPPPLSVPHLAGERRVATIVLADVKGSTELLEEVGTERWVEIMNRLFQVLEGEIYRFGGSIDQFRGDGLVAFFGAAAAHEDDPERAVLAGLAMQEALRTYAEELRAAEGVELQLRVGVNTGEVIVTSVGDRAREDTAMGEAIAIAARMETAAEPGTVLVSENTYRLISTVFEWEALGEMRVKGVSEPLEVYRPLAPLQDADRLGNLRHYGFNIPLIGRQAEFQVLKESVEGLYEGRGGIVLISGEQGTGKSFLVTEVRNHFARQGALLAEAQACQGDEESASLCPPPTITWLRGRCHSYNRSWPYAMWLDLFQDWLDVRQDEGKEETRDRLRERALALWGEDYLDYYPYLATFLSLPLEEEFAERVEHLNAEARREQFFRAVRSLLARLTLPREEGDEERRLVLSFADTHWADAASLDLLRYCLPLSDARPLLWFIVFRPDRTSPIWEFRYHVETEYPHRLTSVTVPSLTQEESEEFIERLVGEETLPAETSALIVSKAEGNPYYIQELIHSLIADGTLTREAEGGWRLAHPVNSLDLPDSLQTLLLARIDRLAPQERRVLQMASVIGVIFWSEVLESLVQDAALGEVLTALQRSQLIVERGWIPHLGMEYAFKSSLVRDAAYEGLLSKRRMTYHARITEFFENRFKGEGLAQYYGLLAYHNHGAGRHEEELYYTIRAGDHARSIYANVDAVNHYTRALEVIKRLKARAVEAGQEEDLHTLAVTRFEALSKRRDVYELTGEKDAVEADARTMLELARRLEDEPGRLIDALLQQPAVRAWQNEEELYAGIPMTQKALALARQIGDRHREMRALVAIVNQRLHLNDPTWQKVGEAALELARDIGDRRHEASILVTLGKFCSWTDQPQRGIEYLEHAVPICEALDDRLTQVSLLDQLGLDAERTGDYYRLLTDYQQERLAISREIGYRVGEAQALTLCGQTRAIYLGDYEGGLGLLKDSLRVGRGTLNDMFTLLRVVQIHADLEELEEGREALARLGEKDEQAVFAAARAGLRLVMAMLYVTMGDEEHLRKALALLEETLRMIADNPLLTRQYEMAVASQATRAHLSLAELASDAEAAARHRLRALEASRHALETFEEVGFVQVIECVSEEVLFRHAQALEANGEGEAVEYVERAHEEMMRKHDLIPVDSYFRRTYLENIPLHRAIAAAHEREVA